MHTGLGADTGSPAGESSPVSWLILNTARVPLDCPAAMTNFPEGSMAKFRGVFPRMDSFSTRVNCPVAESIL